MAVRVANNLSQPVGLTAPPGDTARVFIVEKTGTIRILRGGQVLGSAFLDISNLVSNDSEQGLLGLAFHPQYASNGKFYIYYTDKPGGNIHVCANTLTDFQNGETLCLLGTIDLTRGAGQSKFSIAPSAMFDASLQDLMWTVDTNSDFRIAQFRVYSRP